jgi:hypothetical protein
MPGSFVDVDGGINFHLEDNGFDPTIITDDPGPRRRGSPPAANDDGDLVKRAIVRRDHIGTRAEA